MRQLGIDVWDIKDENELEQLYDFIQNTDRKMPAIVITENEYEQQISQLEESITNKGNELLTALIQVEEKDLPVWHRPISLY